MLLLQGTSEQALVELINANNVLPVPLEPGDLYYGIPKSVAGGGTRLPVVTQFNNEDYEGYAVLNYKRLNLSIIFKEIRPVVEAIGQTSLTRLLPVINKATGLSLEPNDIVDQSIVWLGGNEQANLQFVIQPYSLAYEGRMVVQFIRLRPDITSAVVNRTLPILAFPDPIVSNKKSMSMATWGFDFTEDQSKLKLYGDGWWFPQEVKAIMAQNGFADYPVNVFGTGIGVTLHATTDVPGANTAYSHVIIQKNVVTPEFNGDAYFHFNRA